VFYVTIATLEMVGDTNATTGSRSASHASPPSAASRRAIDTHCAGGRPWVPI